jgi:hypothetical protein
MLRIGFMKILTRRRRRQITKGSLVALVLALLLCAPTLNRHLHPVLSGSSVSGETGSDSIEISAADSSNPLFSANVPAGSATGSASSRATTSQGAAELDPVLSARSNKSEGDAFAGGPVFGGQGAGSNGQNSGENGKGGGGHSSGHSGGGGGGGGSGGGGGGGKGGKDENGHNGNTGSHDGADNNSPESSFAYSPPSDRGSSNGKNGSSNSDDGDRGSHSGDASPTTEALYDVVSDVVPPSGGSDPRSDITPVPEPATYGLMGAALLCGVLLRRRFQTSKRK